MTTATEPRPVAATTGSGTPRFGRLLRAEWTKLISVRRWVLGLLAAGVATTLLSVLSASGSGSDENQYIWDRHVAGPDGSPVVDDFYLVHQPLTGDGTITAQVEDLRSADASGQDTTDDLGMAGLIIKDSTEAGAAYAAVTITADGVSLDSNFSTSIAGSDETPARWLRLTRSGTVITGYESPDGQDWEEVGSVDLTALPTTVEAGLFVGSAGEVRVERQFGSTSVGESSTIGTATFGSVALEPASGTSSSSGWRGTEVGSAGTGDVTESGGVFTVRGSGEIAPYTEPEDDLAQISLIGVLAGLVVVIALGVLFMTSEYRRGMIRTTFTVLPRRARVLAAKAVVIGGTVFAVGLVACVVAFQLCRPILRSNGFGPPAYSELTLADPLTWRAVAGSALLLALAALIGLGLATILRHSAAAITATIGLFIVPMLIGSALPPGGAEWLMRLTPAGGFALQRSRPPAEGIYEPWSMISSLTGLIVVVVYASGALAVAAWLLRRRDA